ncbi:XRE family transcriptional regulator [Robertmurraya yapensis]|uniref:XRE family transcriptional regulator n=2 Tax=Bacillaceae TaxID=186817 RepID=A0A3S0KJ62_9BACI|nr:helix-turn-helix domain-containing protein [Bacillus yapensis]RTR27897.1 XRE family transcriptional regulator [Bacillus yapensis]TKS94300.1 helix-turn-helix domain-containing protein [Bacillus yapensis]
MARYLGQRIKEARERLGLSQYETSKDICTQAYISKIEKGNVLPTADILLKLADRFSIDISYLLDISSIPRHDYVIDAFTQIRESINNRDYTTVRKIVETEKNNFLFMEKKLQQFLTWHEGICYFQLDQDLPKAIQCLEEALDMTINNKKFFSEREIEILISQANIFSQSNMHEEAINKYEEAMTHIHQLSEVINKHVPVRLFYNYARIMRLTGNYYESIHLCDRGLKLTEKHMLMYLRGDLYFQKAYNYKSLKDMERAVECFKFAEMVYILENNQPAISMVKKHLDPLTSKS